MSEPLDCTSIDSTGTAVQGRIARLAFATTAVVMLGFAGLGLRTAGADEGIRITPGRSGSTSRTQAAAPASRESWQVIYLDDQRIGYTRSASRSRTEGRRTLVEGTTEVFLKFKRFGQTIEMRKTMQTVETADGNLLSYTLESHNPPAAPKRTVGRVERNQVHVETTMAGRTQTSTLDWDPEVKSPGWQDRLLKNPPMRPRETRTYKAFAPELQKLTTVRVSADDYQYVKVADGTSRKLLKLRITQSILPEMTTRAFIDEDGTTLRTEDDFGGKLMVTFRVSREEAMKAIAGEELDIAVATLIHVGALRQPHEAERIVYRMTLPGDDPARFVSAGGTQTVRRVADDAIELTVSRAVPARNPRAHAISEEYTKPTAFLQSDDARVIEHVRRAALGQTNPYRAALQCERYVHEKLAKKNFSTALASAAEVARSLEGDCTEHAMLLAAMLRAAQVPSRVAVGLVYVEGAESFAGHMWTEAWIDGEWFPLDATRGKGGIGGGHIRLAESSLADDAPSPVTNFLPLVQMLGRVKIEVVEP